MSLIHKIISYLVGALFIFSGLIKLNDPVGTEIKLEEYFEVFASDKQELYLSALSGFWHFLVPYSLSLAVMLSVLEVVLGVSLIIRYRLRFTLWALLLTIIFFTFLTFYSAYFNKVTDCGCFGDAIKLTPWQSFGKDIVLLVLIVFLFSQRNKFPQEKPTWTAFGITTFALLLSTALALQSILHEPPIDFRPYKIGANIPNNMKPSAELKYGKEIYTYTNLKAGKDEKFGKWEQKLSDTLAYKFKAYEKPLLNSEALPKITDYKVYEAGGNEITKETFKGDKLLIIIADALKANRKAITEINKLAKELEKSKVKVLILTASDEQTFENFRHEFQLAIPYYFVDKTVLKTMIRSNPGLIWLKEGTVKSKWHYNDIPDSEDFN